MEKPIKTESLFSKVMDVGRKAVIGTITGAIIASPLMAKGWEDNKPEGWAPPGQEKKPPPPAPFPTAEVQYNQMIDWFLYEASPIERLAMVDEFGPEMPELYGLYLMAPQY
jgi:hypothetical protein